MPSKPKTGEKRAKGAGRPKRSGEIARLYNTQGGATAREVETREQSFEGKMLKTLPDPPEHLGEEGRREWENAGSALVSMRMITRPELPTLEMYCESYETWKRIMHEWQDDGSPSLTDDGQKPHPMLVLIGQLRSKALHAAAQLGLTPVSRPKMGAIPLEERDEDDELFSS